MSALKRRAIVVSLLGWASMSVAAATTLAPLQLRGRRDLDVRVGVDEIVGLDDEALQGQIAERLRAAGFKIQPTSSQLLEISIGAIASSSSTQELVVVISVRVKEEVRLVRDPSLDLRNHPATTWESRTFFEVALPKASAETAEAVFETIDQFIRYVQIVDEPNAGPEATKGQ